MKKFIKRLLACFLTAGILLSFGNVFAVGTPYEVKLSGVNGTMMSEDNIEFERMGAKTAEDKTGYYYSNISTTGDFYVDIKVRIPKGSVATSNFRVSFAKYVDANGTNGTWLNAIRESGGYWTSCVNGETLTHKLHLNKWWTFRLIFSKDANGIYNLTVLNVNAKGEYETWSTGTTGAKSLNGWMTLSGEDGTKGASLYDLAQFEVKMGSPEGDNSQLEVAKNFIEEPDFLDIENESERAVYKELYSLGLFKLMEDDKVHPAEEFTKKQMADSLVALYGINPEDYEVEDLVYVDLTNKDMHKSCFIAVNSGIMESDNETLFGINDRITYGDMADYMLKLLGYGAFLDFSKDIQESRFQYASVIGLFDGADASSFDSFVTRKNAAIIVNNVKDMNVIEVNLNSSAGATISDGDETVLNKYSNIYKEKNVMLEANADTCIYSAEDATKNGIVRIGGIEYNVGDCDLSDFPLGSMLNVTYTYDEDEDERTLVKVEARKESAIYIIEDDNLISIDDNKITAEINGKSKSIKYSKPKVVYNRRVAENMISLSTLVGNPDEFHGRIILVDNSSGTDVLTIEKYKTAIVKSIDVTENIIYDKYGNDIYLKEDCYSLKSTADVDLELEKLEINDVLTIMESLPDYNNEIFRTIYYSKSSLKSQVISGIENEGSKQLVKIGEKEYSLVEELTKAAKDDYKLKIILNMEADFLLDIYGNIAGFINVNHEIIGYVVKSRLTETDDGEEAIYVKVFNADAVMEELYVNSEKCIIDGSVKNSSQEQYAALTKDDTTIDQTVIKYKKNKEGFITKLDTVNGGAGGIDDTVTKVASAKLRMYNSTGKVYANKIGISSNAVNFMIPIPGTEMYENDSNFSMGLQANKSSQVNEAYSVSGEGVIFDETEKNIDVAIADVTVTYTPSIYTNQRPLLVTSIETVWEERYDEIMTKVDVFDADSLTYKTLSIKSDTLYGNNLSPLIDKGFVFAAAYDLDGNIINNIGKCANLPGDFGNGNAYVYVDGEGNAVTKDAEGNTVSNPVNNVDSTGEKAGRILGDVYYLTKEHLVIKLTSGDYVICGLNASKVFEVNRKSKKVEESAINSINVGDRVFVYYTSANARMIVKYK